jgi:tRNA dimethylallyltransferase
MQIYQGLDITTAKPTKAELEAIPHHLIGVISPDRAFSVADYVPLAERMIDDIVKRGKVPILAGGTGLYIKSLRDGIGFDSAARNDTVRERLTHEAQKSGDKAMWERLNNCDPESAKLIPPQNMVRIIRALEVFETTGIPFSSYRREAQKGNDKYYFRGIYLDFPDRLELYSRINDRVDNMIETGMVDECKAMYDTVTKQHMNLANISLAIGYKELIPYFNGETTLEAATETIKQSTRRYAKRQLTWFRHDEKLTRTEVNYNESADNKKNFNKIYEFFSKQ